MKRRTPLALAAVAAAALLLIPGAIAKSDAAQATKVRVCYPNAALNYAPMFIAAGENFDEREGIDIEPVLSRGTGSQVLQAGGCEISLDGAPPYIVASERGADFVMVGSEANRFGFKVVARVDRGIRTVADLKGKKLAVSGPHQLPHQSALALLAHHKLVANKDVDITHIAVITGRLAALSQGSIDAGIFSPPVAQIENDRVKTIADLRFLRFPVVGIWTKRGYAQQNGDAVKAYLRAIIATNKWMKLPQNKEKVLGYISQVTSITDREGLLEAYAYEIPTRQPEPLNDNIAIRNAVAYTNENFGTKAQPSDFMYTRLLEQVTTYGVAAKLDARSVVPRPKGARGAGTFAATLRANGRLAWRLSTSGVTGPASAHLSVGARGKTGPVRITLCTRCRGTQSGTTNLGTKLSNAVKAGLVYVDVRTKRNAKGELRGQLAAEPGK